MHYQQSSYAAWHVGKPAYQPQHNAHMTPYIDHVLREIMIALECWYSLEDWYACGDDLI